MKRINILLLFVFVLMLCLPELVHAQTLDDPGGDPADAPIDGGLSILIAGGVAYVAKKGYDKKKKSTNVLDK